MRIVLVSADIQSRLDQFDWLDAIALKERNSYRRFRLLALWATMVATIVGALSLLPIEDKLQPWQRSTIQVLQALAVTLSFAATIWVSMRQSVRQWLQARAVAERLRADVFRALIRAGTDAAASRLAAALACFRDAHLDWQIRFYAERGAQYRQYRRGKRGFDPYSMAGNLLLAVAVVLGSLGLAKLVAREFHLDLPQLDALVQWVRLEQTERWQLGLGAMATSILAFATMRSFIDVDDRNASLYPMTYTALQTVRNAELEDAEAAAASGNVGAVMAFCESVQTILDKEHLAWTFALPPEPVPTTITRDSGAGA
ncbi:MAG: DUF4231 domain-containing protein [Hyphomicrobiaceae bacterium]